MNAVTIIITLFIFAVAYKASEPSGSVVKKVVNTLWITGLIALIFGADTGEHLGSVFYQGQLNIFMILFLPIAAAILIKSDKNNHEEDFQSRLEREVKLREKTDAEMKKIQERLDSVTADNDASEKQANSVTPTPTKSDIAEGDIGPNLRQIGLFIWFLFMLLLVMLAVSGGLK